MEGVGGLGVGGGFVVSGFVAGLGAKAQPARTRPPEPASQPHPSPT